MVRILNLSLVAVACLSCPAVSFALQYGDPLDKQTNPPYTAPVRAALKNLGSWYVQVNGAWQATGSPVLIHPQWIVGAPHGVAYDPSSSAYFDLSPGLTSNPKYKVEQCHVYQLGIDRLAERANDIGVCRLDKPVPPEEAIPVPLIEAPDEIQPDNATQSQLSDGSTFRALRPKLAKWGRIALLGHSNSGKVGDAWLPAVVDFVGLPHDFEPARGKTREFTQGVSGDSGSGVFWLSPSSPQPALMGVMAYAGQVPRGAAFFRKATLDWIEERLAQHNPQHTVTRLTQAQHFTGPAGDTVAELTSPPVVKSIQNSRASFNVTWPLPATNTPPVASYEVSLNLKGCQEVMKWGADLSQGGNFGLKEPVSGAQTACVSSVGAGYGNQIQLTGLVSGEYTVCARPLGVDGQAALGAFLDLQTVETPNCQSFDTAEPLPVMSSVTYTMTRLPSTAIVKFNWQAGAHAPVRYEVIQTTSYPTVPGRVRKLETTATSYTASSTVGSVVCLSVQAFNKLGMKALPQSACVNI